MSTISASDVKHIALLANLVITEAQTQRFTSQLVSILDFVNKIQSLPTNDVEETSQVTGLENVLRDDEVEDSRTFTQDEALRNATKTYKGYFVVPALLAE